MKLGAERQKVIILVGLLLVAIVVYFVNSTPSDDSGYTPPTAKSGVRPSAGAGPAAESAAGSETRSANARNGRSNEREFRPSLRPRRGEARPDPTTVDPTLRLEILAKLRQVNVEGMHRSIFDFGQAPPPKPLETAVKGPKAPSPFIGPPPPPPKQTASVVTPPKPQAPPVPMKFFGYISPSNQPNKKAFFVEGEEIHVVREGDVVRSRYKIVRIGVNSVVVEDMQFNSQQTVPLEEQPT